MWRRLRRRTMAPRRPAVFPEQWPLVAFTTVVLVVSIGAVVVALR